MENETVFQLFELMKKNWPEAWGKTVPEVLLFLKIGEQLEKGLHHEVEKSNTLAGDFKVLFRLRACGPDNPQSPTALYTKLGITSGGLTKILHRLKQNEHITRISNPDDGRSKFVKITSKGEEIAEDIFAGIVRRDLKYLSVLDKRERKTMNTLCEKLIRNYSKQ